MRLRSGRRTFSPRRVRAPRLRSSACVARYGRSWSSWVAFLVVCGNDHDEPEIPALRATSAPHDLPDPSRRPRKP
jgi:hypothetical protein